MVSRRLAGILAIVLVACAIASLAASWGDRQRPEATASSAQGATASTVSVLLVGDPFATVLEGQADAILAPLGLSAAFERAGYDATRRAILAEHASPSGSVDIVAFDVVWTAEFARRGALLPIDALVAGEASINTSDYLASALAGLRWEGRLYGLPIQPHAELLWGRRDLLDAAGQRMPATPAELLAVARALHRPEQGVYGIVWNAQRGSALGQTVAHLYAAFGERLLGADGRPALDGPGAVEVVRLLRDLVAVSPPDILTTAWDQRRRRFIAGQAGLTFEWGARMGEGLLSPDCRIAGLVICAPPPVAAGVAPVAPFGTWCLGIPATVGEARQRRAWQAIAAICGPGGARRLAEHGNAGVAQRQLLADDALGAPYAGLFPVMRRLDAIAAFQPHVRPATPLWDRLCHLLGEVYHEMLLGDIAPELTPAEAQRQALELWATQVAP